MALIYNATFNSGTRVLSLLDKAGNVISSCEVLSKEVDDPTKPLMFKSQTNGATISTNANNLDFSRNGTDWETYTANTALEVNSGGRVFFKSRTDVYNNHHGNKTQFSMTGEFKAFNNLMSVYRTDFATVKSVKLYYQGMFSGQTGLLKAPMLTQTYIAYDTYTDTFSGCTGLEEDSPLPPVLKFEDLPQSPGNSSYYFKDMYKGCTGLKRIRSFEDYESGGTVQQLVFATGRMFPSLGALPTREKYVSVKFPLALPVDGVVHDTHVPPNATDYEPFYLKYSQDWVLYITSVLREYNSRYSLYEEQAGAYEYSYDGETWNLGYAGYEHNNPVNVPANTKLYIRRCMYPYKPLSVNSGPTHYLATECNTRSFSFSVDCEVGGDTWSLDRADFYSLPSSYAQDLHELFRGTFIDIDNERYSPCSALSSCVNLHASAYDDLQDMFNGCSSLRSVAIAIDSVNVYKFTKWMSGVSPSGDFYCNPNIKTFPIGSGGIPVGWKKWVYGATDTGTTTTMYHNGVAENVIVGTSDYGVCYSIQGWSGFKTLEQMHEAGYTFGEQTEFTLYEYEDVTTAYTVSANANDGFTEAMYDTGNDMGYLTIEQQNKRGYYTSPVAFTGLVLTATANSSSVKLFNKVEDYFEKGARLLTKYRVNMGDGWQSYTNGTVINLNSSQAVKLHCIDFRGQQNNNNYMQFNMTGTIEASGNCNSMLPMDIRTDLSLNDYPYALRGMFHNCKSLAKAPALPATTLASYCYYRMFRYCERLTEVRIAATTTETYALDYWLYNVSATGDFYCDPSATIFPTDSASGIPKGWSRFVLGAEDTGNTTAMYHNGATETVKIGTSDYGVCYALQGWSGFKTLSEMHALGYTFGAQSSLTMYHGSDPVSAYSCDANIDDGFTETMYDVGDGKGYLDIATQNANGYTLTAPSP